MSATRHRLTAWIATFAILLAALAPTLAQALAASSAGAAPWEEICTAAGVQSQPAAQGQPDGDGQSSHGTKHCPWCAGHASPFALPAGQYALPIASDTTESPFAFVPASPARYRHRGASQPRAPPTRS